MTIEEIKKLIKEQRVSFENICKCKTGLLRTVTVVDKDNDVYQCPRCEKIVMTNNEMKEIKTEEELNSILGEKKDGK